MEIQAMDRITKFEELYDEDVKTDTHTEEPGKDRDVHTGQRRRRSAGRLSRNRSRNHRGHVLPALLVIICFSAALGIIGFKLIVGLREKDNNRINAVEITAEQERLEGIRQSFSEGESTLSILRKYYPEDLVLYYDNRYSFYPVDKSLKKHSFDPEKVRKNTDGTWGYVDGDLKVEKGIDVSAHQGDIDWEKVASSNISFAMIRAMYRGYETGRLVEDKTFRTNIENAAANGIKTGVYIFTQAITKKEVDEEISMLSGLLGAYDISYPVVVDVEDVAGKNERMEQLTREERTEIVKYYCERISEAGYEPMIYFNIHGALELVELSELEKYDKWFAAYDSDFYYPYEYKMWQYKDTGKVDGITGNVDFNLYFPEKQ